MITDKTLDEAMVEAARFLKAAKALRAARKSGRSIKVCDNLDCQRVVAFEESSCPHCKQTKFWGSCRVDIQEHAACKRASLDLTHKLADLRAGR